MRNEDKARAHLQSAMKYLGFGMTPEQNKAKTPNYWRHGWEPFEGTEEPSAEGLKTQKEQDAKMLQLAKTKAQEKKNRKSDLANMFAHTRLKDKYKNKSPQGSYEV